MIINIAEEFTRSPAGRYLADGPYSGERFRDVLLVPALERSRVVKVILDGAYGYGSSFLEEAFGGLVRLRKWGADEVKKRIVFVSEAEPTLIDEIESYIDDAAKEVQ